jgi:hypothetical protein
LLCKGSVVVEMRAWVRLFYQKSIYLSIYLSIYHGPDEDSSSWRGHTTPFNSADHLINSS